MSLRRIYLLVIQEKKGEKTQNYGLFSYVLHQHDKKDEDEEEKKDVYAKRENFCRRRSRVREGKQM